MTRVDVLYQMTMSAVDEEAEDGYEEITPPTPAPLDLAAHHRSLWCEVPQVVNSRILGKQTPLSYSFGAGHRFVSIFKGAFALSL